ncbi:M20/M25/M40 family metallo-hydrolase [Promethearchaeum syntrophicum]|uniref:M20/M25/M40 family metallo-hydrolase n=1 Tax=Promethearchaeum syntrophicum TaxID=2594042 RepID=A0A5B9DFP1_9ARCH|nr:M20/M25/M40 family metallo-hydrolase [Candidatus Prometheoarchaeum syntrophicum]QEE17944.1 putative metallohydrolase [Candidatus Prometheoarchaeum syntrophicum]
MITENAIDEATQLISKLIQNKCVNPPGNEMKSIRTIEDHLKSKGIECSVYETAPNRGNLIARIKGAEDGPTLMFGPSHIDVVPVPNPEKWSMDPFGGEIKDGYIWGRGAMDMLFISATQVQAFIKIHEEGINKGELLLFIVSDEEAGGTFGVKWMMENHPELIEADYCLSESGGISIAENKLIFMIGEKGGAFKKLTFSGTPGHGSMPYGSENAVVKASKAILRIQNYCDNKIPITTEYLGYLADGLAMSKIQKFMVTTKFLLPLTLKLLRKKDPNTAKTIHSLSRMTMSPNIVKGGIAPNVIAANASVAVDIRTLPGQNDDYVVKHLKIALGDLAKETEISDLEKDEGGIASIGNASEASSKFISILEKAVNIDLPGSNLVPLLMPMVTDMRFFREKGVQSYGFSLFDPKVTTKDMVTLMHGIDERIRLTTVELTLKVYYNVAKLLFN